MLNIFGSNNTAKDIIDSMPKFAWKVGPSFYIDEKEYTIGELVDYVKNLIKENKDLNDILKSIEEDGTEEHNEAVKFRQENAQLKVEIENWKTGVMHWKELYDEKANYISELVKEVNGLRHLKKENVELMGRVNEIDSDMNKEYQAEIFTLKNDIAVLKAKYQILDHNYQGCTKYRDEYKHQLNAANKEIEALKKEKKESFEILKKAIEDESARFHELVAKHTDKSIKLETANKEIEKLKKDIVDYVFEKDDEIEKLKAQHHPMYPIHWGGYEPEKWSTTKVAVDDAVQAKLREVYGIEEKKTFKPWVEEPIDWKGEEVEFNAKELLKRVTECAESLPVSLPNELQEDKEWICPCNMCKHAREENTEKSWEQTASDLALRVVKLEKKIEELTIIKHTSDPNYKYFLKHGRWPYNNKAKE